MGARSPALSRAAALAVLSLACVAFARPAPAVAAPCGWGSFSDKHQPGSCWRPFGAASPFNRQIGLDPPNPADSALIGTTVAGWGSGPRIVGGIADTPDDYSHPIYFNGPRNPVFRVHCVSYGGDCPIGGDRVRIPNRARPAAGDDAHLAVIDQRRGWEYDFYRVLSKPAGGGVLEVAWGGRTRIDEDRSKGLGAGATASGFALSAGIIRPAELRAGEIDHALFMTVPCTNGHSVYPADGGTGRSCSEAGIYAPHAPAMGQHMYLEMTRSEIEALAVPRWEETVLHAMARYGMFVGDTGGDGWGVEAESGSSFTSFGNPDPWVTLGQLLGVPSYDSSQGGTRYTFDLAAAVYWAGELRVAAPCVSQSHC